MSLVRARTRRGMGGLGSTIGSSGVAYNDTGSGMTPESFRSSCCLGIAGEYGAGAGSTIEATLNPFNLSGPSAGPVCDSFLAANINLFGGNNPCSDAGINDLMTPAPVLSVAPVTPPPSAYTTSPTQFVPVLPCPPSIFPCPCDGRPVVDDASLAALLTCQSLQQQTAQNANVQAQMTANASAQCVQQKVTCAQNALLTAVSSDCATCIIDIANWKVWAVGIGIVIAGAVAFKAFR